MAVVPLIESLYYVINGMASLKDLLTLNLVTKILCKLPWRWTNLSFGADRSKYVLGKFVYLKSKSIIARFAS